jgi:lysophospholipid hydrolase
MSIPPPTEVITGLVQQQPPPRSMLTKVIGFVPMVLFKIVSFATISIPLFFYRVLTWSFTLHLNFSSLLVILAVIATIAYLIVRYRFLTKYSRLKPINKPPKVASSFDLHPDTGDEDYTDKPGGYKNYPDEFLSAFLSSIKIFGYLEQPVFHELARHLQTKKLLAGDTLFRNPEQERSFYIVVDGHVQMFVKPENDDEEESDEDEDDSSEEGITGGYKPWKDDDLLDDQNRKRDRFRKYTLINEVSAGGTLSSLFTILSIFRESFNRSEAKEKQRQRSINRTHLSRVAPITTGTPEMSREASISVADEWRQVFPGLEDPSSRPDSATEGPRHRRKQHNSDAEDSYLNGGQEDHLPEALAMPIPLRKLSASSSRFQSSARPRSYRSVHPNIVARATVDTTLAVIPEEAFHKLTQKFPKAAAHIVQVIVTRFQRVTLMTSHRYLGLTKELLRLEKLVNESASNLHELPANFFAPGGMDRLRRKFNDEEAASQSDDGSLGPSEISRSESSGIIKAIGIIDIPGTPSLHINSPTSSNSANSSSSPTSVNKSSSPHLIRQKLNRRGEYSMEDDEHLRTSVMRCVSDALGIKNKSSFSVSGSGATSVSHAGDQSPRTVTSPRTHPRRYPMDLFSHTGTVDSCASPLLDAYDDSYFDDDADMRSTTSSVHSGGHSHSDIFSHKHSEPISPDDIQILYFPKDAVLVREGAHNNGLFFVIDGLLEASMTPAAGEDVLGDATSKESISKNKKKNRHAFNRRKSRVVDMGFDLSPSSSTSSIQYENKPAVEAPKSTSTKEDKVVASEVPAGRSKESKNADDQEKAKKPLFIIKPGGLAGYLDALTGFPSFVEIKAKTDTYVGYVSKKRLDRITDKNPAVMLKLANQLVGHVSPLSKYIDKFCIYGVLILFYIVLHIDLSLEWMQVNAGQIICREGEPSDAIFMVLHGRLRTIREKKEGEIDILGEFGHGDSVGELEVLSKFYIYIYIYIRVMVLISNLCL